MTITLPKTCALGGSQTGLVGTAGVTLLNPDGTTHTARATAGIYEIGGGCYGKNIVLPDDWKGSLKWDSGGGTPVYAVEDYSHPTVEAIADQVWDEILTGATHNIPTSAGRRVRQLGAFSITDGTAQGANGNSITLEAAETAADHTLNRNLIVIVIGTGKGQTRTIVDYDSATKIAVLDRDWWITPDATSEYQVLADDTPLVVDHGVAQGGTPTTITLRPCASAIDNTYNHGIITILAGTGQGQIRLLHEYDGTTKIATICGDGWVTTPDTTSVYVVMPYGITSIGCISPDSLADIADSVWDEDLTGHTTAKTSGWFVQKIKAIADAILAMVT